MLRFVDAVVWVIRRLEKTPRPTKQNKKKKKNKPPPRNAGESLAVCSRSAGCGVYPQVRRGEQGNGSLRLKSGRRSLNKEVGRNKRSLQLGKHARCVKDGKSMQRG